MDIWSLVWSAMGVIGALGVGATATVGAAYGLFRLFGDKWHQSKFNERLEAFKHTQQVELENEALQTRGNLPSRSCSLLARARVTRSASRVSSTTASRTR